ncbi:MAG: hypothetical protein J6B89_02675 [Bacilli bacterium]|nr:hypothetical protein [Bacilli bacterium]
MYKVKHDYSNTALSWFSDFLILLYQNSCSEYNIIANNLGDSNDFIDKIESFVSWVDDYVFLLVVLGYIDQKNFKCVMDRLSKLKSICLLPDSFRNIDGRIIQNRIQINPNIVASSKLSAEDRTQLCVYYELSRFLHSMYFSDIEFFMSSSADICSRLFNPKQRVYIYKGFEFLDASLAENIAQRILSHKLGQEISSESFFGYNYNMFAKQSDFTNYEVNWKLQDFTINFGKTLDSVVLDNYKSDDEIMFRFSKNSLNKDFINDIISQYSKTSELKRDLLYMLMCLGGIMETRDELLGENDVIVNNTLMYSYLSMFNYICNESTKRMIKR